MILNIPNDFMKQSQFLFIHLFNPGYSDYQFIKVLNAACNCDLIPYGCVTFAPHTDPSIMNAPHMHHNWPCSLKWDANHLTVSLNLIRRLLI